MAAVPERPVMLFDGTCGFCNFWAQLAIRFERDSGPTSLLFANLQSDAGKRLSAQYNLRTDNWDSFVLVRNGKAYTKFAASNELFIVVGGPLGSLWLLGTVLKWFIPSFMGNFLYDFGWRHRKRVFGGSDTECLVPTPALRARMLK